MSRGNTRLLIEFAEKKAGIPGWAPYIFSRDPDEVPDGFMKLVGIVAPKYSRGAKKGQTNWKGGDYKTRKTLFISDKEYEEWITEWEKRTGRCVLCLGKGERQVGWSRDTGPKIAECDECGGTGVSPNYPDNFTPIEPEPSESETGDLFNNQS